MTDTVRDRAPGNRAVSVAGHAALELALGAGLLLLPVTLLVLSLPTWAQHQAAARLASQQAARAVAMAGDWEAGTRAGQVRAEEVAANHRVSLAEPVRFEGTLARGGSVTAVVTVTVPPMAVPLVGEVAGFRWSTSHTVPVDLYRSFP